MVAPIQGFAAPPLTGRAAAAPMSLTGTGAPPLTGTGAPPRDAAAAAQAFEAQALAALLQPAFATVDLSRSALGGGAGEAQWQPMLVEAITGAAARAGGVGIGALVLREMLRWQDDTRTGADSGADGLEAPGTQDPTGRMPAGPEGERR